ncbi:hypothetical protein PFISCL1PPCAC_13223, partial [Pristionchus fissidentatus]
SILCSHMTTRAPTLVCLICGVPIAHSHLGIDSCRACAIFYRRTVNLKRPLKCKGGAGLCITDDPTTSCRKCRFERFSVIMASACAGEIPEWLQVKEKEVESPVRSNNSLESEDTSKAAVERGSFIDHNSYFQTEPTCSETPLLSRMAKAYSMLCLIRRAGELGTCPQSRPADGLREDTLKLAPATYACIVSNGRIMFGGLLDFGRASFEDFEQLSPQSRYFVVQRCSIVVNSLDGLYRAVHYFPDDNTGMAGYSY